MRTVIGAGHLEDLLGAGVLARVVPIGQISAGLAMMVGFWTPFFAFIAFAKTLIGESRLTKIDCHATNYQPGHFLTRHVDEGDKLERRAAYTIGFSRRREPDWGGLLLFLDERLNIKNGFTPGFNLLTVFDGLMPHTVTAVSPFAPAPRLSIAGWFRDDAPARR